jgi:hypothetical protein
LNGNKEIKKKGEGTKIEKEGKKYKRCKEIENESEEEKEEGLNK